eukprot:752704-Hanusia_phi.AAC.1
MLLNVPRKFPVWDLPPRKRCEPEDQNVSPRTRAVGFSLVEVKSSQKSVKSLIKNLGGEEGGFGAGVVLHQFINYCLNVREPGFFLAVQGERGSASGIGLRLLIEGRKNE